MLTLAERHKVLHTRAIVRAGFSERVPRDTVQELLDIAKREKILVAAHQYKQAHEMGYDVQGLTVTP